jgi:hypothetical protein
MEYVLQMAHKDGWSEKRERNRKEGKMKIEREEEIKKQKSQKLSQTISSHCSAFVQSDTE